MSICKCSPHENSIIDSAVFKALDATDSIIRSDPSTGSDERQFCSPGFDLPDWYDGRKYPGTFPEYHTSMDNLSLIKNVNFEQNFDLFGETLGELEIGKTVFNRLNAV